MISKRNLSYTIFCQWMNGEAHREYFNLSGGCRAALGQKCSFLNFRQSLFLFRKKRNLTFHKHPSLSKFSRKYFRNELYRYRDREGGGLCWTLLLFWMENQKFKSSPVGHWGIFYCPLPPPTTSPPQPPLKSEYNFCGSNIPYLNTRKTQQISTWNSGI